MKPTKFDIMRNHRVKMDECAKKAAADRAYTHWVEMQRRHWEKDMEKINEITDNLGLPRVDKPIKKSWWNR